MNIFNLSVYLNSYADSNPSNNPGLSNFKWARDLNGLIVNNPISQTATLAPGETRSLFSGTRILPIDNTTAWSFQLKPLSSNTYILSATSGTLPNFRTPRTISSDATTQITVSMNGPQVTFTSTGGTPIDTTSIQVGDDVMIGSSFNILNQGIYQIIAKTSNSISISNEGGAAEGPITLGSSFTSQFQAFSAAGVQVGDTVVISGGFSPLTKGTYQVTAVTAETLSVYSTDLLPQETGIMTSAIAIYSQAKSLIYLEADSKISIILNGVAIANLEPFIVPGVIGSTTKPGVFMLKSTVYSLALQNNGVNSANIFFASVE